MNRTPTAIVVGAGIAGPATAMALQMAGIKPVVYEAHPTGAEGTFEATLQALRTFLAHPAVAALTICEISPDHDPDGSAVQRFVDGLAAAFAGR